MRRQCPGGRRNADHSFRLTRIIHIAPQTSRTPADTYSRRRGWWVWRERHGDWLSRTGLPRISGCCMLTGPT